MTVNLKNMNKKDMVIVIILAAICLGAVIADVILVVQVLEQWRTVISAVVLTGAAVGGVWGLLAYLKKAQDAPTTTV